MTLRGAWRRMFFAEEYAAWRIRFGNRRGTE